MDVDMTDETTKKASLNPEAPSLGPMADEADLLRRMSTPDAQVVEAVRQIDGPILILGVGGKMGPSLAELLVRAGAREVIGVSRFSDEGQRAYLEGLGVRTVRADLLDETALAALPEAPNIYMMAGFKFGASGNQSLTWAMNTWLPGRVLQRFPQSRTVYVSSGNVYAYSSAAGKGLDEEGPVGPIGEYAQSRLGGERLVEHFARQLEAKALIVRLFYATEMRYGIIHDLAWKIWRGEPIDLAMGHVNQIWQGDANAYLARLLPLCQSPAACINLTGAEVLSVRRLAQDLGQLLDREPVLVGQEAPNALLGDASRLFEDLGRPPVTVDQMVAWMADWVRADGASLGKPTKYESRSGKF
jgi:nucleoside-diphosphate-sugar epimerase